MKRLLIPAAIILAAASLPLVSDRGNIDYDQIRSAARQGTGTKFQMDGGGTHTSNDCVKYDGNGNTVDSGGTCGGSGGGGGLVLVEQHTASASAELDFTTCISSTYDDYAIRLVNLVNATSGASLEIQMSTNGGTSYDTGTSYSWTTFAWVRGGTGAGGTNSDTSIHLVNSQSTRTSFSSSGVYNLTGPASSGFKILEGQVFDLDTNNSGTTSAEGVILAGAYASTSAINAFRVLYSSGNITSGTVRCYGVAK